MKTKRNSLLVMFSLVLALTFGGLVSQAASVGNKVASNLMNGCYAAGNSIYFLQDTVFYKYNTSTGKLDFSTQISPEAYSYSENLNKAGKYFYYALHHQGGDPMGVYRVNENGTGVKCIIKGGSLPVIYGKYIYYLKNQTVYRSSLNGKNAKKIYTNKGRWINSMCYFNGRLYMDNNEKIMSMKMNGSGLRTEAKGDISLRGFDGSKMYYYNYYTRKLYAKKPGSSSSTLVAKNVLSACVNGKDVYYTSAKGYMSPTTKATVYKKTGSKTTKLLSGTGYGWLGAVGNQILLAKNIQGWPNFARYVVNNNGKGLKKLYTYYVS